MKLVKNSFEYNKLVDIKLRVEEKYNEQVELKGDPGIWKLILECVELIIAFAISHGLKFKWYNPLILLDAIKLVKNIVSLILQYLKEK